MKSARRPHQPVVVVIVIAVVWKRACNTIGPSRKSGASNTRVANATTIAEPPTYVNATKSPRLRPKRENTTRFVSPRPISVHRSIASNPTRGHSSLQAAFHLPCETLIARCMRTHIPELSACSTPEAAFTRLRGAHGSYPAGGMVVMRGSSGSPSPCGGVGCSRERGLGREGEVRLRPLHRHLIAGMTSFAKKTLPLPRMPFPSRREIGSLLASHPGKGEPHLAHRSHLAHNAPCTSPPHVLFCH